MAGLNQCLFKGIVLRNPVLTYGTTGRPFCKFRVSVSITRYSSTADDNRKFTTTIFCGAFGSKAEVIAARVRQGMTIYLEAEASSYSPKGFGKKTAIDNIQLFIVREFEILRLPGQHPYDFPCDTEKLSAADTEVIAMTGPDQDEAAAPTH